MEQQRQIRMLLDDAPSLRSRLPDLFKRAVNDGYEIAAVDMNMTDTEVRTTLAVGIRYFLRSLDDILGFNAPLVPDEEGRPAFARVFKRLQE